ncbi:MAG: 2-iminoacetate synthase ThiH [Fibrobacteres bacterium]|nr:2-iminoacetate synthase ThiH [Fibrobacterota bacterium]
MALQELLKEWPEIRVAETLASTTEQRVLGAISKDILTIEDFLALLSPAALPHLETIAERANALTRRHFGNSILIFTPIYISDFCENGCTYCSFSSKHHMKRHHLSIAEIELEAKLISETGIRHILMLTGEAPKKANIIYLQDAVSVLKRYFSAPAIEIYALDSDGYAKLAACGADALTIYQETYNRELYPAYHPAGPKADYDFRLEAPERALSNGFRAVTIGPLLGLADRITDAVSTAIHLDYLQNKYSAAELSVSLPRIRPINQDISIRYPVHDREFVQMILAFRLLKPHMGLTVSTRESKSMRNALLRLGATKMSAGVSTAVGGHSAKETSGQFEIDDSRSVDEMKNDLLNLGFQPVMHDWNHRFSLE